MKLSIIYSIYNRTKLFSRGLKSVDWQTMPKSDFELVVVDDGSTEDIKKVLKPYIGKMNIRYIRYDRKKHPIWQEMNPTLVFPDEHLPQDQWPTLQGQEQWYHTQAISANIGIFHSQGEVCCISQPEILHSPNSFMTGFSRASDYKQIFSEVHWGTPQLNQWLDKHDMTEYSYDDILAKAKEFGAEYEPHHMPDQGYYEMYWYTEYFPRMAALHIGGVDLKYQKGVYAEDDQFKMRMRMNGVDDRWGGRPKLDGTSDSYCVGIHQSHMDEGGKDKKQDRNSRFWDMGAERNRAIWREFCTPGGEYVVANENLGYSPWGEFLITEDTYHGI